jgi:cytochrome o ubiquinol oxidase subunit 1
MEWLTGRLGLEYLPSEPATIGAAVTMPLMAIIALGLLIRFKKLGWLWQNWLTSLDAKKIGIMYIVVAVLMLLRGVSDALMIRSHTAMSGPGHDGLFQTDTFQQVFTAHGTIMIFFVAMGLMFGLINVVMPLMIGARDVAFPWLNSVSFWLFVAGMILCNTALVLGGFSNGGWLGYPPLTELQYNPGPGVDYWLWSLQIAGVGSLLSGVNFIVTILKKRAPGMSLMKIPIFVWSVLVTMVLVVISFPLLTAALGMLSLDRLMGMHFFTSDMGGNPMLYINLIWAWGHPEVYILVLPAFGVYSEIVATFARKKLFGYGTMVAALVAISFFSFLVWLHHFFTMGAGANVNAFFGIMTMVIAVPTGVKIFNWLFTMYRGRIRFTSPFVWFLCFVVTFTIGGVTGVMMAVPAIDFQVHNTLFLVAHFHNTIIGGVVFGFMAAITYWFPKLFGFTLNERLGKYAAYLWQLGFIVTFAPLYMLGLMGAVRRIDTYTDPSWKPFFIVSAVGVVIILTAIMVQVAQFAYSIYTRKQHRDTTGDPWDGRTLEWSVPSPAPFYNFAITPRVNRRDEWWYQKKELSGRPHRSEYQDIMLPKNTSLGVWLGVGAGLFGFGAIWHMWWLMGAALIAIVLTVIKRTLDDQTEYTVTAEELFTYDSVRFSTRPSKQRGARS